MVFHAKDPVLSLFESFGSYSIAAGIMNNISKILARRARRKAEVDREPGGLKAVDEDDDVVDHPFCCTCKEDDCAQCMSSFRVCAGRGVGRQEMFAYTKTLTNKAAGDIIEK